MVEPFVGEIGMVEAGLLLRLACRKAFVVQNADDLGSQGGLGLFNIGSWVAQVAEHVAASAYELKIVCVLVHRPNSFRSRLLRSRIRSRSLFGVLIPWRAFF